MKIRGTTITTPIKREAVVNDTAVSKAPWSSQNTVDKLCPPIHESGTVVQCEPVEGYPLAVTVDETSVPCEITLCGKNLYDSTKYPLTDGYYINNLNGVHNGEGKHETYCATLNYIPVTHLRGQRITLNYLPGGSAPGIMFYDSAQARIPNSGGKGDNVLVPNDAVYMRFTTTIADKAKAQIELGSVATAFEPYSGANISVKASEVEITARNGVNTIYVYDGDTPVNIEVIGRANPGAIIEKLTNAIISLGGNV
jgi:hypothetical protein